MFPRNPPVKRDKEAEGKVQLEGFEGVKQVLFGLQPLPDCWCRRGFVYRNLHQACFSVRCYCTQEQHGRVILHLNQVMMKDVVFKVSEAGRKKVLQTQQKNVHAGIQGRVCHLKEDSLWCSRRICEAWIPVTYNPYGMSQFQTVDGIPVWRAQKVYMDSETKLVLAQGLE